MLWIWFELECQALKTCWLVANDGCKIVAEIFGAACSNNCQVCWDDFNTVGIVVKSTKRSCAPMFDKGAGSLLIDGCKRVAASTGIFGC